MRESGILMPVSSLPGPYGIGCFGKKAEKFVDFLAAAGQKIWQILPLSPTGYGDSPYQSCSAFAGNPYFIDLDALKAEGLLTAAQLKAEPWGKDPLNVDYGTLYTSRYKILRAAYAAWRRQCAGQHGCAHYYPDAYYAFTLENEGWLEDYALYMALKTANGMKSWTQWPREYRKREPQALEAFKAENEEEIGFWKFLQYEFSIQWKKLKAYANANNVQILGDIPIYVSADSVDAWVGGPLFELAALPVWRAARRITSRQTASSGATRCTTGPTISRPDMPGGSSVSAMRWASMTCSASTTSVVLRATTPSLPETRQRRVATGKRGRIAPSSMPSTRPWVRAASLQRIWDT